MAKFSALADQGQFIIASAWSVGIWVSNDAGLSWTRASVPSGFLEVEDFWIDQSGVILAATELGLISSVDQGLTWHPAFRSSRMTAVTGTGPELWAGDWRGGIYRSGDDGVTWTSAAQLGLGIWGMLPADPPVLATTGGFYTGYRLTSLGGQEVTGLFTGGGGLYATVAQGFLYQSADGGKSWREILQPQG
jgi:hypothetical protein